MASFVLVSGFYVKVNGKAIPHDKIPGYTFEKDEDILQIHEDILKRKEYEEISICTLKRVNDEIVGRTIKVAVGIQKND